MVVGPLKIGSWNIRGLGSSLKRLAVFSVLESSGVDLVCLQETHLTRDTSQQLQMKKFQYQFHAYHSSFSRGVSIFVKAGVKFSCRQTSIDDLGRYIFLLCSIDGVMLVVANIYIPPPFNLDVLLKLHKFLLDKKECPIVVVGDFNEVLDRKLDRFPIRQLSEESGKTRLSLFLEEVGLVDLWRVRNPGALQYTCCSMSHSTLSRIDLILGNDRALQLLEKIAYWPRGISDHSLMVTTLNVGEYKPRKSWSVSPHWFEVIKKSDGILSTLREFVEFNQGSVDPPVLWDTLKAFLRGVLIQQMAKFNKEARSEEEGTLREAIEAENNYQKPNAGAGKHLAGETTKV